MNPKINPSPSVSPDFELELLFRDLLAKLEQIELDYHEAWPQRSAELARSMILDSLQVVICAVRAGLRVQDRRRRALSGDDSIREMLAAAPTPTPLALAFFEIIEVQSFRPAPLLRHNAKELGEGAYHYVRRYIKAGAAAAVEAFQEIGLGEEKAAELVTDALNKGGFISPRREKIYSKQTIKDWRKRRLSSKAGFDDHYREWLLYFRGTLGRVEQSRKNGQSWTAEQVSSLVLFRLVNLAQAFAYQV